jgi:hypothetical protein
MSVNSITQKPPSLAGIPGVDRAQDAQHAQKAELQNPLERAGEAAKAQFYRDQFDAGQAQPRHQPPVADLQQPQPVTRADEAARIQQSLAATQPQQLTQAEQAALAQQVTDAEQALRTPQIQNATQTHAPQGSALAQQVTYAAESSRAAEPRRPTAVPPVMQKERPADATRTASSTQVPQSLASEGQRLQRLVRLSQLA